MVVASEPSLAEEARALYRDRFDAGLFDEWTVIDDPGAGGASDWRTGGGGLRQTTAIGSASDPFVAG